MPGWAHLQPIRGILRQYAGAPPGRQPATDPRRRWRISCYIRDKKAKYFEDNPRASAYVDGLLKQDIRYLAHEYLNEYWTSFYFSEVAGMFGHIGAVVHRQPAGVHEFLGSVRAAGIPGTLPHHDQPARDGGPQRLLRQHGLPLGSLRQAAEADAGGDRSAPRCRRFPLPPLPALDHASLPRESGRRDLHHPGAGLPGARGPAREEEPAAFRDPGQRRGPMRRPATSCGRWTRPWRWASWT